jgi:hypothetical protein
MTDTAYFGALGAFLRSWDEKRLEDYFRAPRKKYSTTLFIPTIGADAAPKAFGVDDIVEPRFWAIHYKGEISAPETGKYRFWGYGDDVLVVRLKRRDVLQGNWNNRRVIEWQSDDEQNRQYKIFSHKHETLYVGDWVSLKKGEPVPIEILVGECGGGQFSAALLIEQKGRPYASGNDGRPILPIFKTKQISPELAEIMKADPGELSLEGPVFAAKPGIGTMKSGVGVGF